MTNKKVVLIGAGIVSATLATLIRKVEPEWEITIFERRGDASEESSNVWNNAGTGHEALCELNYTPEQADGTINVEKAVEIYNDFQVSKQFWSELVKENNISQPSEFINPLPHMSFVHGEKNKAFLSKRYHALRDLPAFEKMEYTEDGETIKEWSSILMKDREEKEVAATKMDGGTDVNFGALAKKMLAFLEKDPNTTIQYNSEVTATEQNKDEQWEVHVRNDAANTLENHSADFLFIGAGGHSIPLLQKTKIKQSKHLGGFPISGEFLYCDDPEIVKQHHAKAYGKEPEGTPPMTVPHLDKRYVDGKEVLLFGPFAAIGPKFLKKGSNMDFFKHIKVNNIGTLLAAGAKNIPLIKYSIEQILMSKKDKVEELRRFVPSAEMEDWDVVVAGKRVQVIKDVSKFNRGVIHFGTEVINSDDHTLSALLGESPGASTSVTVALEVLKTNFPTQFKQWEPNIKKMIPSYGVDLNEDVNLLEEVRELTNKYLELKS
ncbi:MAG TPA: malate dehydrogenase (quinone) [Pseudogracilibacillus sp.]|nr:malate dehydrogenase (quinone) [Pseudogracilibacillus sp.]